MLGRSRSDPIRTILVAWLHAVAAGGLLLLAVVVLVLTLMAAAGLLATDTAGGRWHVDGGRWSETASSGAISWRS